MTNAHVLGMLDPKAGPPRKVEVILDSGLAEERSFPAEVVAVERGFDLAILRVVPPAGPGPWPDPLSVVAAGKLLETAKVYVIGYPFGENLGKNVTVATTTVSSLRRDKA